jgi:hypothetical protein
MAAGQLGLNTNTDSPGLYFKDSNGGLIKAGPVHVGSVAPNAVSASGGHPGNTAGELWLDTTGGDYNLKTWDGTAWRALVVTSALIKDGTIVNADISNAAAIGLGKLATGSLPDEIVVDSGNFADGSLSDAKLSTITSAGKVSGTAITSGTISTSGSIATTAAVAVGRSSAAANTKLDVEGGYAGNIVPVAALDINCSLGNYFTKTISANSTFTFSGVPTARAYSFTLELTHTSGTLTWPSSVNWPADTAPTLTTGKTHLFMFVTDDGGSRWRASSLVNYTS